MAARAFNRRVLLGVMVVIIVAIGVFAATEGSPGKSSANPAPAANTENPEPVSGQKESPDENTTSTGANNTTQIITEIPMKLPNTSD